MKKSTLLIVAGIVAVLAIFACAVCFIVGVIALPREETTVSEVTTVIHPEYPTFTPTAVIAPPPAETPQVEPVAPPDTPVPEAQAIQLVAQGFGQDGRELGFAFVVENPNTGLSIEGAQYQFAAYDDAGTVVATDSGYITLLLPNQKLGVGNTTILDEGVTASRIEVQLRQGEVVAIEPIPPIEADSIAYYPGEISSSVTGIVRNPYNRGLTDIRVSAIAYNEAGEIVGGGFTFLNFILANSSTGVDASITSSRDVAIIELHPSVSGLTFLGTEDEFPEGATALRLVQYGFGQDDRSAGFGMLIENPNEGFSVEDSQYHLTAFAEDGRVLATDEGYVKLLLPRQTLGVGGDLFLDDDMSISRVEIQILDGDYKESDPTPYFTAENVTFQEDTYSSRVTGQIVSPYAREITDLRVSAIGYNDAGEINGGGYTFLDFIPANGKSSVEVSITCTGTPATTELYAVVSSLSDFE